MAKEKSIFEKARALVAGMFSDDKKPQSRKSPEPVATGKKSAATNTAKKAGVATKKPVSKVTTKMASVTKAAKKTAARKASAEKAASKKASSAKPA